MGSLCKAFTALVLTVSYEEPFFNITYCMLPHILKQSLGNIFTNYNLDNFNQIALTLCVRRVRKVDNAELARPTVDEKSRQKNISLFLMV